MTEPPRGEREGNEMGRVYEAVVVAGVLSVVMTMGGCKKENSEYCDGPKDCAAGQRCDVTEHRCVADGAVVP